ncbi:MAG: hypothetical protein EBX52_00890 [Proteobacteria bacterium]|nr:hypothetical protein [Pseudomonadota bacterium]
MVLSVRAQEQSVENCDRLYSMRGASLIPAVECYAKLSEAAPTDRHEEMYERRFIALSAIVNDSPKTAAEMDAIKRGISLVDAYAKEFPDSAGVHYWKAVFVSFDAIQKDRGFPLPRNLFAVLKSIQDDLRKAISKSPSIHVYGPARVLGIMHTQMPGIVGGDKTLAEKMLAEAYLNGPALCSNHVAYAKILQVNGKTTEAKAVLTRFLSMNDLDLNPYPEAPLRGLKPENERDRKVARDLLEQLNGD